MDRPKVGVAIVIFNRDKVLAGIRKTHGAGTLAFPGGHLEGGESFIDCANRENNEETGLKIRIDEEFPFAVTNDIWPEGRHYITCFMRAYYVNGSPKNLEPDKCEGWDWYSDYDLRKFESNGKLYLPVQNLRKQGFSVEL